MERGSDYRIKQEIMNLEKDFENTGESLSALRNYVQQMEPDEIHSFITFLFFLQEQSDQIPYCTFLCELMAREHGKRIIPYISNIMEIVVKIVSASPSERIRVSCARAVSALARYTIDIGSPPTQVHTIFRDIVNPLLDSLLGTLECVAEASAFCFIALVETAAWKFAPNEVVSSLCLTVTSAMHQKGTRTSYHMKLVERLACCNGLILEGFCRSLFSAGAEIVEDGASSGNLKQQLNALQMIGCLLQHVKLVASDLEKIILSLQKWTTDRLLSVRSVARDVLQMALVHYEGRDASPSGLVRYEGRDTNTSVGYRMIAEGEAQRITDSESGGTPWGKLTPAVQSLQEVGSEGPSQTDSFGRRLVCKRHASKGRFSFSQKDYPVSEIPLEGLPYIIHKSIDCDRYGVSEEREDRARDHSVTAHLKTNEVDGTQEAKEGAELSEHPNGILMQDGLGNRYERSDCDGHASTLPKETGYMRRDCNMPTVERSRTTTSESDTQRNKNPSNLGFSRLKNSCRVFGKGFLKVAQVTGTVLGLAAFALPAMMVIVNACVMDEQYHTLVPT